MSLEETGFKTALAVLEEQGRVGIQVRRKKLSPLESPLLNKERHASFKNFSEDNNLAPKSEEEDNTLVQEKTEDPSPSTENLAPKKENKSLVMVQENSNPNHQSRILAPNVKEDEHFLVQENFEVPQLESLAPDDIKHQLTRGTLRLRWRGEIYEFTALNGVPISAGGSVFIRMTTCGKKCRGCPHGPYLTEKRKIDGVWRQRNIGKANRLGAI